MSDAEVTHAGECWGVAVSVEAAALAVGLEDLVAG